MRRNQWKDYIFKGTFELRIAAKTDREANIKLESVISEFENMKTMDTKGLEINECKLSQKIYDTDGE